MSKQFQIYANGTLHADHIGAIRSHTKDIEREMLAMGNWVTGSRIRVEDSDDDEVRVFVEVSGPKCVDAAAARAHLIALGDLVKSLGGSLFSLGFALGHTDENAFEERPDLQTRPSGEDVPEPVSAQLVKAAKERDDARAELLRLRGERDAAAARAVEAERHKLELGAAGDVLRARITEVEAAFAVEVAARRDAVEAARVAERARLALSNQFEPVQ